MKDELDKTEIDLLYGLAAIGKHVGLTARQTEHLIARGELPSFKLGASVCARKSTLARHFAAREAAEMCAIRRQRHQ